jgi:hypothetical protein
LSAQEKERGSMTGTLVLAKASTSLITTSTHLLQLKSASVQHFDQAPLFELIK